MDTLRIGRCHSRYRLPADELGARSRLDRLLRRVCSEALEPAVANTGDANELVCLRHVHANVRLDLDAPDYAIVGAWGAALAAAIRAAVSSGDADVVRYESRAAALLDLMEAATAGDLDRCWAWRQLGLWRGVPGANSQTAADEVVRSLVAEPEHIVPVFVAAARRGSLRNCAAIFGAARWRLLADAALTAHGAAPMPEANVHRRDATHEAGGARSVGELEVPALGAGNVWTESTEATDSTASTEPTDSIEATDATEARELRPRTSALGRRRAAVIERSSILWATVASRLREESERRALVALAALEVNPAWCRGDDEARRALLDALIHGRQESAQLPPQRPVVRERVPRRLLTRSVAAANASSASPTANSTTAQPESAAQRDAPTRRRARTTYGGLLFLLHVVDQLGLPEEISNGPLGADHSLRWVLYQVALALVPITADDPAALAFAGLAPDREPPCVPEGAMTEAEHPLVRELAVRIGAALVERLPGELLPDQAIALVCRRQAEILADAGWIEVRLALDDLTTDIRRAALDLDLGFVEWLGVAVMFKYV